MFSLFFHKGALTCCGRVSPPPHNVLTFPSHFQGKYLIGKKKTRSRIFTPQNLFLTLVELISGTNNNGYTTAILGSLGQVMKFCELPVKSALSQIRSRISYKFFEDKFREQNQLAQSRQKIWNGLHVYAIDGIQLTLPRTNDIILAKYSGRKVSKYRESYMPKMFVTAAYDVISGVMKDVRESSTLNEIADAHSMVKGFEDNSLTIYDRLYVSRELIHTHNDYHNFFLFRLRQSCLKELRLIYKTKRKRLTVEVDGITVHVIKIKNPKTGEWDAFASNLPLRLVTEKTVRKLYNLRWEVENAFRDFTQTIKLEQWHSKSINGIRQEFYLALWLYNFTKLKILSKFGGAKESMKDTYRKPNFKILFGYVAKNFVRICKQVRGVWKIFVELIDCTMETRTRHSRSYKREIKSPQSPFPYNNTRWYGLN